MTEKPYYLGIDLGATSVKTGVVSPEKDLKATFVIDTAGKDAKEVLEAILASVRQAVAKAGMTVADIAAVGVASPGPLDLEAGIICDSPNIHGWRNIPLSKLLNEELGLPAILENDANAAALGEYHHQADPRIRVLAMYTLGTGIGGGIVIDGKALHGAQGNAAELGHIIVEPDGRQCACGQRGCAEAYASANSTAARAAQALQQGCESSLSQVLRAEGALTAKDVADHARQGDALAVKILDQSAYYLALLSVDVWHVVDPQIIVLGGGMAQAGDILLNPVRKHFQQLCWKLEGAGGVQIVLAKLGNQAGMIGAASAAALAFGR